MDLAEKLWTKSLLQSEVGSLDDIINAGKFLRFNVVL